MSVRRFLHLLFLASLIFLGATTLSASAFERPFPANIKRGNMTPATPGQILIDGQLRLLTAGAQIRTMDNLIVLPTYLKGRDLVVNYTENEQGEIHRVWMLSEQEAAQPIPPISTKPNH